ncbi:MAG TPA: hypothetical protein VH540_17070 [Ktedonobacterales bacterium]|jgi:hypothetical protein
MTVSSGECVFIILLVTAFIGLWRGWLREIITMAILLAVILFLITIGNHLLYQFIFVNLSAAFHALLNGNSVTAAPSYTPPNAEGDTLFTLSTFTILTGISYLVGHKAGRPPTAAVHRLTGIIPGAINGIAITWYSVTKIIPDLQVNAQGPNQGSVGSYEPAVFGIGLVFLIIVLFVLMKPKPKK